MSIMALRTPAVLLALALVSGSFAVVPAVAYGQPKAASAKDKDAARALAKDGIKAYDDGDATHALELLKQAEALFHAPPHLLYIARSQAKLGHLLEARATYQKLAGETLDKKSPDQFVTAQATGQKELGEISARIPKISLKTAPVAPSGLTITRNGAPEQAGVLEVDPGSYTFTAKADGGLDAKPVTIQARERETIDVELRLVAPVVVKPVEVSHKPNGLRILSIATMAVGAAGLVGGGALAGLSVAKRGEADDAFDACEASMGKGHCSGSLAAGVTELDDTATTFGNAGIGALVGGGVLVGTGVALFVVSGKKRDEGKSSANAVSVVPVVAPGYAGIAGRF